MILHFSFGPINEEYTAGTKSFGLHSVMKSDPIVYIATCSSSCTVKNQVDNEFALNINNINIEFESTNCNSIH